MKTYVLMSFPKCFPHSLPTFNFNTRVLVQKEWKLLKLSCSTLQVRCLSSEHDYTLFPHTSSTSSRAPHLCSSARALRNEAVCTWPQQQPPLRWWKALCKRSWKAERDLGQHSYRTAAGAREMLFLKEILKILSFLFTFLFHF